MNCAICGKDNQAGTRFCVHCGAALAVPAGGSRQSTIETAGAILGPKPSSANAPAATQNVSTATTPRYAPPRSPSPPAAGPPLAPPDVDRAPAFPAYDADPKKAGWIVIAIAALGVVAVIGYVGYKVTRGGDVKDTLTRIETLPQPAAPQSAPSHAPSPPPTAELPRSAESGAPPAEGTRPSPPPESTPSIAAAPAAPKAPRTASSAKSTSREPPTPPVPPVAPIPAPQVQARPVPAPAPVQAAAAPDRWGQFVEELHRCERETFLSRVVCDQRIRLRYCDGYWGKVPQCPGGIANPDRGQ